MDWLESIITRQRGYITDILSPPMRTLARQCAPAWGVQLHLDHALTRFLAGKPDHRCRMLYIINKDGIQVSSNIFDEFSDSAIVGQNLSGRPYLNMIGSVDNDFVLSRVYLDKHSRKPCITALHCIRREGVVVGYLAADFNLEDLPLRQIDRTTPSYWRQIKGDPSIRDTLFQQTRSESAMDIAIDIALPVIASLICSQGIFHAKLHFSSSRATLWPYSDPHRYRIHVLDEILDPSVCLVYAKTDYPDNAVIGIADIDRILGMFKQLRMADDTIYLRSASLNIMNGLIGLNFSCDGSHYMPASEFLARDTDFWFGSKQGCCG